jgi:hypothetical protein
MSFSGDLGNWFDRHERHAELLGAPGKVVDSGRFATGAGRLLRERLAISCM